MSYILCGLKTQKEQHYLEATKTYFGDPWVAQRFGPCLWPRAQSWRPGIESHIGLPVHGACFSLCLCLCLSLSLSLCVCDGHKKKKKRISRKQQN